MEDEAGPDAANAAVPPKKSLGGKLKSGLTKLFNHAVKHVIWMAPLMAFGILAMAPAAAIGATTLPDLALATLDSAWSMVSSAVMDGPGVIADIAGNTVGGDFSLNYEWGMADHSAHAAGFGHEFGHGNLSAETLSAPTPEVWEQTLSPTDQEMIKQDEAFFGIDDYSDGMDRGDHTPILSR